MLNVADVLDSKKYVKKRSTYPLMTCKPLNSKLFNQPAKQAQ